MITVRMHIEPINAPTLSRLDWLTILRGQLTIIRGQAERGMPVTVESIVRAEQLARGLETEGLAV